MSEKLVRHENAPSPEQAPSHERHEALDDAIERGKHAEHEAQKSIEAIKKSIEEQAVSGKEVAVHDRQKQAQGDATHYGLSRSLKKEALKKTLKQTRKHLNAPERTLSRVIHQPTIDKVSAVAGKTVARPSGILIGGIGALIGTTVLYFMSKYYGFTYNFLAYTMLFCACYIAGVSGEYIVRSLRKLGRKH